MPSRHDVCELLYNVLSKKREEERRGQTNRGKWLDRRINEFDEFGVFVSRVSRALSTRIIRAERCRSRSDRSSYLCTNIQESCERTKISFKCRIDRYVVTSMTELQNKLRPRFSSVKIIVSRILAKRCNHIGPKEIGRVSDRVTFDITHVESRGVVTRFPSNGTRKDTKKRSCFPTSSITNVVSY